MLLVFMVTSSHPEAIGASARSHIISMIKTLSHSGGSKGHWKSMPGNMEKDQIYLLYYKYTWEGIQTKAEKFCTHTQHLLKSTLVVGSKLSSWGEGEEAV